MRHVTFTVNDGTTVDLEVQPRFEQIVREQLGLEDNVHVSDADLKRFWLESMRKASK